MKTIAAFGNSREGGTLLIGVSDDGGIFGLDGDYATLVKSGKDNRDLFMLHLSNIMDASIGTAAATNATIQIHTVDGHDICRVHVRPSEFPVEAMVTIEKKAQFRRRPRSTSGWRTGRARSPTRGSVRSTSLPAGVTARRPARPHRPDGSQMPPYLSRESRNLRPRQPAKQLNQRQRADLRVLNLLT